MEQAQQHSDALIYLFNGGALAAIVGLFVHLIRVTIPKKDERTLELLTQQATAHALAMEKRDVETMLRLTEQATAHTLAIDKVIKEFREDIRSERESHDREIVRITSSVDKLAEKLDRDRERNSRS